jgi:acyl transferase domain-containing protein
MKTVLVLESGVIPPNVNFERVNPKIPMDKWNLRFPTEPIPFPVNGLRRASISSFGFGGTNAHVILDDSYNFLQSKYLNGIHRTVAVPPTRRDIQQYIADHQIRDAIDEKSEQNGHATNGNGINGYSISGNGVNGHSVDGKKTNGTNGVRHSRHPPGLFVWSSFDEQGIERISKTFSEFLFSRASPKGKREEEYLDDLAYTLASKRTSFPWKSYCLASSVDELAQTLSKAGGIPKPVRRVVVPQVGFVFTGQGAQWYAMGRELFVYPIFTKRIEEADTYFKSLGSSWTLMDELRKDKDNSLIDRPSLSQPSCTALQVALVDLLASWDVRPARVIGHSSGEIGAAYCAGALDRESAWKVAYYRGIVSEKEQVGAMMAVGIAELELQPYFNVVNREIDGIMTIACFNSPKSLTISGDERKIDKLKELLDADQVFARKLKVRNPYHSAHMQSVADEYLRLMEDLQAPATLWNKSREGAQMFSAVTGKLATNDELANAEYWVSNMVSPVRFEEALLATCSTASGPKRLRLDKDQKSLPVNEIIELGPHIALQGAIKDTLATDSSFESIGYHGVLNRNSPEVATILRTMGVLHSRCLPVKVESVNKRPQETPREPRMLTNLPSYKFNHARTYWPESRFSKNFRSRKIPTTRPLRRSSF